MFGICDRIGGEVALSRKWKIILISAATPVVLAVGYYIYLDFASKVELEKAHKRLRAAGMFVTVDELSRKFPDVPDDENAIVSMSKTSGLPDLGRSSFISLRTPKEELILSEANYDKYIAIVDEVLNKPKVNFSKYWTFGWDQDTKVEIWVDDLCSALFGKARLEYIRGRRAEAFHNLVKAMKLANLLVDKPDVNAVWKIITIEQKCLQFIEAFSVKRLTQIEMKSVKEIRDSMRKPREFLFYYSTMPIFASEAYRYLDKYFKESGPEVGWQLYISYKLETPALKRMSEAGLLSGLAQYGEIDLSVDNSLTRIGIEVAGIDRKLSGGSDFDINTKVKEFFLVPGEPLVDLLKELQVHRELFESSLDGRSGLDPFSIGPFKRIKRSNGELIYSFGTNRIDNGGSRGDIALPVFSTLQ